METIYLNTGKQIVDIKLQWTNNINMYIKLTHDNKILISAPKGTKMKIIKKFLKENINKFIKHREAQESKIFYDLEEGWTYFFGKKKSLKFLSGFNDNSAKISGKSIWILTKSDLNIEKHIALKKFLKSEMLYLLEKKQDAWELIMNIPKHKIKITSKHTSWASNSLRTRTISYANTLIFFGVDVFDYIIIHELSHYFEQNHGPSFWKLVERFCPEYKKIRLKLKNSQTLSES